MSDTKGPATASNMALFLSSSPSRAAGHLGVASDSLLLEETELVSICEIGDTDEFRWDTLDPKISLAGVESSSSSSSNKPGGVTGIISANLIGVSGDGGSVAGPPTGRLFRGGVAGAFSKAQNLLQAISSLAIAAARALILASIVRSSLRSRSGNEPSDSR